MLSEEGLEGRNGVEAEGIVGEVDGVKFWESESGSKKVSQGGRDLGEQARGEDVGEVGNLCSWC